MKGMRKNAKTAFASLVYEKIKKMAKKANVKVSIPRTCGRQTIKKQHQCQDTSRLLSTGNISSLP